MKCLNLVSDRDAACPCGERAVAVAMDDSRTHVVRTMTGHVMKMHPWRDVCSEACGEAWAATWEPPK